MNGETRINPYVSDLRAEQLKQYLEHKNTYGWQISALRFLLPWSTILASPVQSLHPELKPCLKIASSSSILYHLKESSNPWNKPGRGLFPLQSSRCHMTYQNVLFSCYPLSFPHWWPAGVLPASSCSPQTQLCLSWVSVTCQAGCRAERLVNRWRDGTDGFNSLCPFDYWKCKWLHICCVALN